MKKNCQSLLKYMLILMILAFLAGGIQASLEAEEQPAKKAPAGNQIPSGNNQSNLSEAFKGTVMDVIHAGRYAYIQIETGKKLVWVAVPGFDGAPGDKVDVPPGVPVADFQSRTLKRKFDMIYFVGGVRKEGESAPEQQAQKMPQGQAPTGSAAENPMMHPSMGELSQGPAIDIGKVEKAKDGQTVSEIITGSKSFNGKQIRVRAKVIKFTPNIMGKNWVHVRDGSGVEGANELIITTTDTVKVGDMVMVSGVVSLDRDYGFGLKYPLIIENAKISAE